MNAPAGAVGRAPRQTMRAIVQAGYGSADILHLAQIGRPAAAGKW